MLSRIITGSIIVVFSLWLIVYIGFIDGPGVDYQAIIAGLFFLIFGVYIMLNNKEDKIEEIKKQK